MGIVVTDNRRTEPPSAIPPGKQWQFSLRQMLVAVTLLSVLFAASYYGWLVTTEAQRRGRQSQTSNDFKIILLGLDMQRQTYRDHVQIIPRDPNSGQPLYSWRYFLLPYVESSPWSPDVAWDSPQLASKRSLQFPLWCGRRPRGEPAYTRIVAVIGPGTAWGDGTMFPLPLNELDGDTILLVETRNSGIHWMQPGDFDLRTMPRTIGARDGTGICGEVGDEFHVGLADGSVRRLPHSVPFEVLEPFFTIEGARRLDLDTELAKLNR
jgi:hypothetical protein